MRPIINSPHKGKWGSALVHLASWDCVCSPNRGLAVRFGLPHLRRLKGAGVLIAARFTIISGWHAHAKPVPENIWSVDLQYIRHSVIHCHANDACSDHFVCPMGVDCRMLLLSMDLLRNSNVQYHCIVVAKDVTSAWHINAHHPQLIS